MANLERIKLYHELLNIDYSLSVLGYNIQKNKTTTVDEIVNSILEIRTDFKKVLNKLDLGELE